MALNINLTTSHVLGDQGHLDGHNATNAAVNTIAAYVDSTVATNTSVSVAVAAHEADTTAVHGITDTSVLETSTGSAAKVTAHAAASDPHADRAYAAAQIAVHAVATDPHADRAYADTQVALRLAKASNLSDLASASTARTNLGLGGAATLAVGTSSGTVAAGDDSRVTGAAQKSSNLSDLASATTARANLGLGNVTPVAGAGNGSTDDRSAIAAADTTAVASGYAVLLPPGTYRVASNLTVASPLIVQSGAVIKPDSGVTVTLAGGVDAPRKQVFDHSAGGVVAPQRVDFYHPAWWGATGGSDDTAAWTAVAAAVSAAKVTDATPSVDFGQRILAPAGVNRFFGVTLTGCHLVADKGVSIFYPSGTPTSGSMLTTGDYVTITGGYWRTNGASQAVTLLDIRGYRNQVENTYVVPAAASSIGISLGTGSAITPVLRDNRIHSGSASGGTGIYVNTTDAELSNTWIGPCTVGINFNRGAARINNMHIWGCATGSTGSPDDNTIAGLYLDSNLGWGIDWTNCDRNVITAFTVWNNGATTASTGGIHLQQTSASACKNNIIANGVFDDNTGVGLYLDGACAGTEVQSVRIASRTVDNSGGAAVGTYGIQIGSSATNTRLQIRGISTAVTTALVNDSSTSTAVEYQRIHKVLTSDQTFTSTTTLAASLSIPVGTSEKWLIDGLIVCDGGQTGDAKFRLQATSATGSSGYGSFTVGPAASAASTSAVSMNPVTTFALAVSGGSASAFGTVGTGSLQSVVVSGYLATSTTAGTLDLQAAQNTSDGTALTVRAGTWLRATRIA